MNWTTKKPLVPGWYWWRLKQGSVEQVVEFKGYCEDARDCEWSSSPLEPPTGEEG